MNSQEMATAAHHDIPVKVFLMNNGHFGMVRQWQELFWEERYQSVEMGPSPDWVKLADAYGWTGMRCDDKGELRDSMRTALEADGPGAARRPRDAERELLPDDPRGPRGARHGGLMGEPGTPELVKLEDLEAASALTGRKHILSLPGREPPGRPRPDRGPVLAAAGSTSTPSPSGPPRTPTSRA